MDTGTTHPQPGSPRPGTSEWAHFQRIKEESHMPFGIVDASSDRLVSVRSTVISGDSDNSDYEVLDLNWCPSDATFVT